MKIESNQVNSVNLQSDNKIGSDLVQFAPENAPASGNGQGGNEINLSAEGKLYQQIDGVAEEIDSILMRHVSAEGKKQINEIYGQLDKMFAKDQLTSNDEKQADQLMEKVHNILESSESKLSTQERQQVNKLAMKMEQLESNLFANHSEVTQFQPSQSSAVELSLGGEIEMKGKKKPRTVAELNALSVLELNKLSANELKKLNGQQLNKLNASQLNQLDLAQLKMLNPANVNKLNQAQAEKLAASISGS